MENQLKFIAAIFKMALKEFDKIMGPESIQTAFRLMGEEQGEAVEKRMRKKYNIEGDWSPEKFADLFIKDVLVPALGEGNAESKSENNEIIITVKVCPFLRAGLTVTHRHFCNYTEGLIETAAKKALKNIDFVPEASIAKGNDCGIFKIRVK
ncbi:MAG: methanogen output domain 1-containing protein [Candidatus Helarchaeota archaeon]